MTTEQARVTNRLARRQPLTPEGNKEAKRLFRAAIDEDSDFMLAYAEQAYALLRDCENDWDRYSDSLEEAARLADKAVELSKDANKSWFNDFRALWYRAMVTWHQNDFPKAFQEYEAARALISNPEFLDKNTAELDADMAEALIYYGDPKRAIQLVLDAKKRFPGHAWWFHWILARAYYQAARYQEAIDEIEQIASEKKPNDVRLILAASKAQLATLDDANPDTALLDEAKAIMKEFSAIEPEWTLSKSAAYPYGSASERYHWIDGLRKAGLRPN
jgi:predicted Zn-dependent protease